MNSHRQRRRQGCGGFTLIEVVVAIFVLGLCYAAILSAFSGSLKLMRQSSEYQNALLLAQAKLDEAAVDTSLDVAESEAEEIYGGTTYSYKMQFRDVPLLDKQLAEQVKLPVKLEEIEIEVFWGGKGGERSYKLSRYRLAARTDAAAAAPESAQDKPPQQPQPSADSPKTESGQVKS